MLLRRSIVGRLRRSHTLLHLIYIYKVCCMVVLILFRYITKHLQLLFVRGIRLCDDIENVIIGRLLEHTIRTHKEIVTGLNICEMGNICLCSMLLAWLHSTCDDILLRMMLRLLFRYLAYLNQIVDKRVVLRAKNNLCRRVL